MNTQRTYVITPSGQARLAELDRRAEALWKGLEEEDPTQRGSPAKKKLASFHTRYQKEGNVLGSLHRRGPLTHEEFYWRDSDRNVPLQAGYVRVCNQAADRVIRQLLERGHITVVGG